MGFVRRPVGHALVWAIAALGLLLPSDARAQQFFFGFSSRFELSDQVHVDEADAATKAHLERVKALVSNQQWDEAVETLRQVMEDPSGKVIAVTERRFMRVRDYCHLQIASLPAEALKLYRGRVDPQADKWLAEGLATRDAELLERIVDQYFCASAGDDALVALGDLALEEGDYGAARGWWEKIIETPPQAIAADLFAKVRNAGDLTPDETQLLDRWYQSDGATPPRDWLLRTDKTLDDKQARALVEFWKNRRLPLTRLAYPNSELPLDFVRARLVLVSILEGSPQRAKAELAGFTALYPDARGKLGGREVVYAEALATLLEASSTWPKPAAAADWSTFAGTPARNGVAPRSIDVRARAWPVQTLLPKPPQTESGYPSPRVAETKNDLHSYHPLVVGRLLLVNTMYEIRAYDLATGKPAWGDDPAIYKPRDPPRDNNMTSVASLGAARFTMTAQGGKLYARMGDPLTSRPDEMAGFAQPGYLVCLDLDGEGRLLWQTPPIDDKPTDERGWAFEGSPVADGERVYVALRRSKVRPQAFVGCYDARTGRPLWRQFVCSAETPARGQIGECTHNLLTLDRSKLYYSTNLGAVAALSTRDGRVQWITCYPRAKTGDLNQRSAHFYRDLTPCVFDRGRLFVAPSDTERVFALDAATGLMLWETSLAKDVVHLLGVAGDNLWASGDKLWWINAATGKVGFWPEGPAPKGWGRGTLAGDEVYFPTQTTIHVFDQRSCRKQREIELTEERHATGGNLVAAGDYLVIATSNELIVLSRDSQGTPAVKP
jgi:outer membrane protein assembly factor BamB